MRNAGPATTPEIRRMQRKLRRTGEAGVAAMILAFAVSRPGLAGSVHAEAPDEAVVGRAFELRVIIEGSTQPEVPTVPDQPDFSIVLPRPQPSVSSFTQIINGRFSARSSATYVYQVRPRRTGRLTIPSISVMVEGKKYQTQPITITVTQSDTSGLLYVEFKANRTSVFVEQPFDLTLRIWLRQFRQGNYVLKGEDMWNLLKGESEWGPFAKQAATNRFSLQTLKRKDDQGQEADYYVYEATQQVLSDKPGPYQPDPVTITLTYPVRLGRDFFDRLVMEKGRELTEQAKPPDITIKPIPEQRRPEGYNGAIGRYTWKVWPDRTDVNRGQLIALTMEISGQGRLDRVPAPPLAKCAELTKSFKVLDEQLAGEIRDNKKIYRQQIRAIDEKATAIPPIPFVFFDPNADGGNGRFVTLFSDPIPITVHASAALSVNDIQTPSAIGPGQSSLLTEAADSIRANYSQAEEVLASQVFSPGPGWVLLLLLPPVSWAIAWLVHRHSSRLQTDVGFARRRRAHHAAAMRLRQAYGSDDPSGAVADALLTYVADRENLPAGALTRADAIGRLKARSLPGELVELTDGILATCEAARYAGMSTSNTDLVERAQQCLSELERTWKK